MPATDPNERRRIAKKAAKASWEATADKSARTSPARSAFLNAFEQQVDPAGVMDPELRSARAAEAKSEHFGRLGKLSWESRKRAGQERPF